MKFRVLAEPDMGCFASDERLKIFIQKITEITVSIVTKQIHEEVSILISRLVTSILRTMTTRISIVQKIVIDHITEICSLEDTVTGCETLCDVDGEICIGGTKYPTKYPGGYDYGFPDDHGYKPAVPSYGDHEHPHGYKPEVPTYGEPKRPDGYKPEVPTYGEPKHPDGYKPEVPTYGEPKRPDGYKPEVPTYGEPKHPDGYKPEGPKYSDHKHPDGYKPEVPKYKPEGPKYGEPKPPTGYGDTSTPTSYPTPKPPTIYTDKPPISKYPSGPKPPSPPPTAKYPYPDLTKAKWIWTKDAITKKPGTPYSRPFRKVIKTESPVDHLSIITSCDRRYTLYVNGLLVGCGDNWENPDSYTVEFEPRKEVVIAVYGSEDTGKGQVGLLASGKLWNSKEDKPKEISFVSDEGWKTCPGNVVDVKFCQPEYKDTTWESAYVVENYGGRHWGSLKPALPAPKKHERWTNKPGLQDAPEAPKAKLVT